MAARCLGCPADCRLRLLLTEGASPDLALPCAEVKKEKLHCSTHPDHPNSRPHALGQPSPAVPLQESLLLHHQEKLVPPPVPQAAAPPAWALSHSVLGALQSPWGPLGTAGSSG